MPARRARLLPILRIDDDCHRSVVQQFHFHICAKLSCKYLFAQVGLQRGDHFLIQGNGYIRFRGPDIGGAIAFFGSCVQGELAYQQNIAAGLFYGEVHYAGIVIKDPQIDHFSAEPVGIFCNVGVFNTDQHEQPFPDGCFQMTFDADSRMAYTLDNNPHFLCEDTCCREEAGRGKKRTGRG